MKNIQLSIKRKSTEYAKNKMWKKIVGFLSLIIFFITIYFLVEPGITETTTYKFNLIDSNTGAEFAWKENNNVNREYNLDLFFTDTNGDEIEGQNLTLELNESTDFKNIPYGLGVKPIGDNGKGDEGLDLIKKFNLYNKTTSNGNKYVYSHAEVLVNGTWHKLYTENHENLTHWHIWCGHASVTDSGISEISNFDVSQYGWKGTYDVYDEVNNTYAHEGYRIDNETKFKLVYKLVMNGNDSVVASVGANSGISFKIFDYSGNNGSDGENNVNANGLYQYFSFRGSNLEDKSKNYINKKTDADGFILGVTDANGNISNRARVENKLDETGNPVFICGDECSNDATLQNKSLGYLFGNQTNALGTTTQGVTAYNPTNTLLLESYVLEND